MNSPHSPTPRPAPRIEVADDTLEQNIEEAMSAMASRGAVIIPPYPAVALKLGELLKRDGYGLPDIVAIVSADASLAADLLRCANSTAYSRGGEVRSVAQAVTRLGAREVVRLAVASGLSRGMQGGGALQPMKRAAWQCSVASAVLCQELAAMRGLPQDDAFLCGLLHDYGRLIAIASLEEIFAEMPDAAARPVESWTGTIERLHVKLGLLLTSKWKLPHLFQDVIAMHHGTEATWTGPNARIVEVVASSDAIVALMLAQPSLDAAALAVVPRLHDAERARLAEVLPAIPGVIASFEGEAVVSRAPASKTAPVEAPLPEGFRRLSLPVMQLKPKKRGPYTLRAIATGGWIMTGKDPIAESSLIEVEIAATPRPIVVWGHVTRCTPAPEGSRVECKAFASSGATSTQMHELFRSAPP